jgi:hypothetical protein
MVAFKGVITKADLCVFHKDAKGSVGFGNFYISDWRDAVICFSNDDLHSPASEPKAGGGGGGYECSSFRFGALLGRPDQLHLLRHLERYEVLELGNVRRVFTDQSECMKWSVKVSNFLDTEEASARQAQLFT